MAFDAADAAVADAVTGGGVPGAVLVIAHNGQVEVRKAYGFAALRPQPRLMLPDTLFDLASLTKCVATATAAMILLENGKLFLDTPIARYLPAFRNEKTVGDKIWITVRHLLTHAGGLAPGGAYAGKTRTVPQIVEEIAQTRLRAFPGTTFIYSDFSAVLLQAVVETIAEMPLNVFCQRFIYGPLGMTATGFRPFQTPSLAVRCAATTSGDDTPQNRGIVHDPTARALGGVSGNAGLFSTADDLLRFSQMLLGGGQRNGVRILKPETVRLMTTKQSPFAGNDRALGWDLSSPYSIRGDLSAQSFGHTGFTGTSLWIDPACQAVIILLTNAVHSSVPTASRTVIALRRKISNQVAAAFI